VFDTVGSIATGREALRGPPGECITLGWRGGVGEYARSALACTADKVATLVGDAGLGPHRDRLRHVQCEEQERECQSGAHGSILRSGSRPVKLGPERGPIAAQAAASISISASRSAMTSSNAEIACWIAAICINSQLDTGPLRFCSATTRSRRCSLS